MALRLSAREPGSGFPGGESRFRRARGRMGLGVLDNDPHPLSKTPGKPPEKNGIGKVLDGTKALQMGRF
jgi:hypothetical protein